MSALELKTQSSGSGIHPTALSTACGLCVCWWAKLLPHELMAPENCYRPDSGLRPVHALGCFGEEGGRGTLPVIWVWLAG